MKQKCDYKEKKPKPTGHTTLTVLFQFHQYDIHASLN